METFFLRIRFFVKTVFLSFLFHSDQNDFRENVGSYKNMKIISNSSMNVKIMSLFCTY